jgi:cobalt-zinc-cadmium resistance protein CzcA
MLEALVSRSIRHRGLVVTFTMVAALLGALAFQRLPIDAVPDITNNQVQVNILVSGLSPGEMEQQVTLPVESALGGIPGLESTRSFSRNGFSQVTVIFQDGVDIWFARNQIAERLAGVKPLLPAGAEPTMGPVATGLGEIYMWVVEYEDPESEYVTPEGEVLRTPLEKAAFLRTVQDWIVRPRIREVTGVAGVDSNGGWVKQYVVEPDPLRMASYGVTWESLADALRAGNDSAGAGWVEHQGEARIVNASGRITHPGEIAALPVATRNGVPIRVADVAQVRVGGAPRMGSASESGHEAVLGTALMRIGGNSRTVAAAVDVRLAEVRRSLPDGVRARTVLDRQKLVGATLRTVEKNLAEGAALVVLVILLLLLNLRAALICAAAIPLAMMLAAAGMLRLGVSGNLMSLGAIDFGLIVDGAVIIVENCLRRLGERYQTLGRGLTLAERLTTVREATVEMLKTTTFGGIIIIMVYVPILALSGVEGKMFHPMAWTVILALAAAFTLSLTFVPAMVALTMRGDRPECRNPALAVAERAYSPVLDWAIRWPAPVIAAGVLIFAGSLALGGRLGQEFAPTLDEGDLVVMASRIPSISIEQATRMQLELEKRLAVFPEVAVVFSRTGTAELASDPMPPNLSDTFLILKPRQEWPDPAESKDSLRARMEQSVAVLPGNMYEWTQPIQMRFNELMAGVRADFAVKVVGQDFAALERAAAEVGRVLDGIPGAADVLVEPTSGAPVLEVRVDREAVARYGLTTAEVQEVLAAAVGGSEAGVVFESGRRVDLVVRLPDALRNDMEAVRTLPILLPPGRETGPASEHLDPLGEGQHQPAAVPLEDLAELNVIEGVNQISHEYGSRRVVVQCNVRGRDLGGFVAEAKQRLEGLELPAGAWLAWGGQYENLVAARSRLALVVPACFAAILLLLYMSFRSWRDALLIFTGVPLGLSGGVLALWWTGTPLSISAAVGFIALSGIAVLNGLVLVSRIRTLREAGATLHEAVREGALHRLRPVLTTALVASLGFLPMALATGTGAEVQKPLATVVIGGLITSTLLTLVILPATYRMIGSRRA